jgi:hypothetical protein
VGRPYDSLLQPPIDSRRGGTATRSDQAQRKPDLEAINKPEIILDLPDLSYPKIAVRLLISHTPKKAIQ